MKSQGGGKIITMSSIHGLGGTHYCSLYEATKAGILNFTRGAAFDLGDYGIQVNCIAPGAVPVPKDPPPDKDGRAVCRLDAVHAPLPFRNAGGRGGRGGLSGLE